MSKCPKCNHSPRSRYHALHCAGKSLSQWKAGARLHRTGGRYVSKRGNASAVVMACVVPAIPVNVSFYDREGVQS